MIDSKKHMRTCQMCQKNYKYCNNCSDYDHLPTFMLAWCSSNCKDLSSVMSDWGSHMISSEEAAKKLAALDTSRMEYWNENFQAAYNQIMAEAKGADHKETPFEKFEKEEEERAKELAADKKEPAPEPLSIAEEVKNSSKKRTTKSRAPREKN